MPPTAKSTGCFTVLSTHPIRPALSDLPGRRLEFRDDIRREDRYSIPLSLDGRDTSQRQGRCTIATTRKQRIHRLIVSRLSADLALFSAAAKTAHAAAIHEENIPDNKYDTLSLEASYLAQGQANRAQEIKSALTTYRNLVLQEFSDDAAIRLSALVTLKADDGETRTVFIGPEEGGMKLDLEGGEVLVITPSSPLGRDLIGKTVGDAVELGKGRDCKEFEITDVS